MMFNGGTIFNDAATGAVMVKFQNSFVAGETIMALASNSGFEIYFVLRSSTFIVTMALCCLSFSVRLYFIGHLWCWWLSTMAIYHKTWKLVCNQMSNKVTGLTPIALLSKTYSDHPDLLRHTSGDVLLLCWTTSFRMVRNIPNGISVLECGSFLASLKSNHPW